MLYTQLIAHTEIIDLFKTQHSGINTEHNSKATFYIELYCICTQRAITLFLSLQILYFSNALTFFEI